MLTVQMKQQQVKVVGNKKWCSQLSDASHPWAGLVRVNSNSGFGHNGLVQLGLGLAPALALAKN